VKIAAIDIGSNSIHMVVARVEGDGTIEVVGRFKEMARLGEETLTTGYLSEAVQERGLAALKRLRAVADAHRVDDIVAVATSATREARNGENFIARIRDETGINARVITGVEEGRLIYLGAREVYTFGSSRALIIDIGGGSVEFIVADQRRDYLVHSLPLGVRRLRERFLPTAPPTADQVATLEAFIQEQIARVVRAVAEHPFDTLVATSGTASTHARVSHALAGARAPSDPGRVPRELLEFATTHILSQSEEGLATVPELEERRRDTAAVGAVLLRTFVRSFGVDEYVFIDAALREGMIVDYLERNRPNLRAADDVPDPRRRSVMQLAGRFYTSSAHALQVARLATRLFDDLAGVLRMSAVERELLEYAAILHNVGNAINRSAHHKHSMYVIRNGDLAGFSERERLIMANLARYHRNSSPKSRHPDYMELGADDRELVKRLSVLMRLANALDRGHRGNVHALSARVVRDRLEVRFLAHDDAGLELAAIREHAPYVHHVLGLVLDVETNAEPQPI
jgi:exopolyphosphatase/guanosine-5'-triphosphate,3'-diphosphate pyrophosphatase